MKYLIYLFWITVYARSEPIRRILGELSRKQRRFLLVLVGLVVIGQLTQSKYPVYPLVYWGMYSEMDDLGRVYGFSGVRRDGSEFRLPMTELIRTHSKRFVWRLRDLSRDQRRAGNDEERARLEAQYDQALRSAWALYRSRSSGEEIVTIRVRRAEVTVRGFLDPEGLQWDLFREVQL
jgi:hypothetical protein